MFVNRLSSIKTIDEVVASLDKSWMVVSDRVHIQFHNAEINNIDVTITPRVPGNVDTLCKNVATFVRRRFQNWTSADLSSSRIMATENNLTKVMMMWMEDRGKVNAFAILGKNLTLVSNMQLRNDTTVFVHRILSLWLQAPGQHTYYFTGENAEESTLLTALTRAVGNSDQYTFKHVAHGAASVVHIGKGIIIPCKHTPEPPPQCTPSPVAPASRQNFRVPRNIAVADTADLIKRAVHIKEMAHLSHVPSNPTAYNVFQQDMAGKKKLPWSALTRAQRAAYVSKQLQLIAEYAERRKVRQDPAFLSFVAGYIDGTARLGNSDRRKLNDALAQKGPQKNRQVAHLLYEIFQNSTHLRAQFRKNARRQGFNKLVPCIIAPTCGTIPPM